MVRPDQDTSRPLRRIAFGSCRKQKRPQPVWDAVAATEPELWLWTGDSIYPQTPTTPELLRSAYEAAEADRGYQAMLSSTRFGIEGVYDDHDFGENDGGRWCSSPDPCLPPPASRLQPPASAGSAPAFTASPACRYAHREAGRQLFLDLVLRAPRDSPRRTQEGGLYAARVFGPPGRQVKIVLLDTRYGRDSHALPSVGASRWLPKAGYFAAMERLGCAALGLGRNHEGDPNPKPNPKPNPNPNRTLAAP